MPYTRYRYARPLIKGALKHSPIVGVLGHRQVGKTTLVSSLSKEYITFDSTKKLEEAMSRAEDFLKNRSSPFGIDEAQLCPPLFPAVKEWVRVHPKKGQFIFTGSIRFTSRKIIRESLTGRIVNVEILPMTVSEIAQEPLPKTMNQIMKIKDSHALEIFTSRLVNKTSSAFKHYLEIGGLPGICFFRNESVRHARFDAHLDTILNRDLSLILKTTLSNLQLRKLATFIAKNQGKPFELKESADFSQISTITVKKILLAFESLFLIRIMPTEGSVAKPSYFFEDQGLATYLNKNLFSETENIMRGLYANLRQELYYNPHPSNDIFSFRTHDGTNVPLAFKCKNGVIGIIVSDEPTPTLKAYASAKSFLKSYPKSKLLIACNTQSMETRDFEVFTIPYWWLV